MATVTPEQTRACYDGAVAVLNGGLRRVDAIRRVAQTTGMKENPAAITIDTLRHLIRGNVYKLPLGTAQTGDVLHWIEQDFGIDTARTSALTVLEHIRTTEGPPLKNGPQHSVRAIAEQILAALPPASTLTAHLAAETTALAQSLARTPADRAARLAAADPMPRTTTLITTVYLRNPDVVATVLMRANGTCEDCTTPAPFLRRTDNSPYLEVHHHIPLAENGPNTVANAVALCPNCHRRAHHGHIPPLNGRA